MAADCSLHLVTCTCNTSSVPAFPRGILLYVLPGYTLSGIVKSDWISNNHNPKASHLIRLIIARQFLDKFIGLYSVVLGATCVRKQLIPLTYERKPEKDTK